MHPIVLDIGTYSTKIGLANCRKNQPDHVIRHSNDAATVPESTDPSACLLKCLNDFEAMARNALHSALHVGSVDHPLVLIEKVGLDRPVRERIVEQAFEGLGVPAFYLASESLMALYSIGLPSGIVLVSGHSTSYVSTVHEGHRPPYGVISASFGGRDVTHLTRMLLNNKLGTDASTEDVGLMEAEEVKHRYGCLRSHIALPHQEKRGPEDLEVIGRKACEMLISPGKGLIGMPEAITRSVYHTDEEDDYEPVYFRNVMLCGGNTMFDGIKERLEAEISLPEYLSCGVRVVATPFRQHAAWVGGSVAASLPSLRPFWITRRDYSEYGGNILRRKCLPY